MASTSVGRILFLTAFLFFFAPANGNFPNLNGASVKDFFNLFNATDSQKALLAKMYQSLAKMNWASILESQFSQSMSKMELGQCGKDIAKIRKEPQKLMRYIDAAGKPHSGIFQGSLTWVGNEDECRQISDSHFCGTAIGLAIPSAKIYGMVVAWTACFPKSCNERNISALMSSLEAQVSNGTGNAIFMKHHGSKCQEPAPYTTGSICTLVLCGVLLTLCLIGTMLEKIIQVYDSEIPVENMPVDSPKDIELTTSHSLSRNTSSTTALTLDKPATNPLKKPSILNSFCCEFFLCFSLLRNTKRIFDTNVPPIAITSINGVRVISMSWIVLGHTFLLFIFGPYTGNKYQIAEDGKKLSVMAILNAFYAVDSFFFLSGLLVAYTCFRKIEKGGGKFNWILFYVHRFWRLTPPYMFVILFNVHLKPHLSSSFIWYTQYKDPLCLKYWWTNLLYINNFHPKGFNDQCIGWSWYLANDMQFFVITPLLLIIAFKYGWRGVAATAGSLLMISSVVIATLYGYYDLDPLASLKINHPRTPEFQKKSDQLQNYIYSKPYCRIQPYLVGFILGYFIYKKYSAPKKRGWIVALIGWAVAFTVAMTLVYGPHNTILPDAKEWSKAGNIAFGTLQRFLWGLVLAWVTYACHHGYGGFIQDFLSAKFWIPLSRLTYSVYLIHMIVLTFMLFAVEGTVHNNITNVAYYFLASMVLSYGGGFILAVVVEFPCENLEKWLLGAVSVQKGKYAVSS